MIKKEILIEKLKRLQVILSNWALFSVIFAFLFVWPSFGQNVKNIFFDIFISLVIILSIFSVSGNKSKKMIIQFGIAIIALWLARFIHLPILNAVLRIIVIVYFFSVISRFITLVSKRKTVDKYVIIEAINGYMLMGIAFSLLIGISSLYFPHAFNFSYMVKGDISYDPIYYSFVTLSTLGYGDKLPLEDSAKAISLMITLSGQFYLVTIMAFIVGKMLAKKS